MISVTDTAGELCRHGGWSFLATGRCHGRPAMATAGFATLEPDTNPDQIGNPFGQFAAEAGANPGVLAVFATTAAGYQASDQRQTGATSFTVSGQAIAQAGYLEGDAGVIRRAVQTSARSRRTGVRHADVQLVGAFGVQGVHRQHHAHGTDV